MAHFVTKNSTVLVKLVAAKEKLLCSAGTV